MTPPPHRDGLRQRVLEAIRQPPDRMVIRSGGIERMPRFPGIPSGAQF